MREYRKDTRYDPQHPPVLVRSDLFHLGGSLFVEVEFAPRWPNGESDWRVTVSEDWYSSELTAAEVVDLAAEALKRLQASRKV